MSDNSNRYQYFTVGLLKDSAAMEALKKDAFKYHMIDQPGKLIALRLTEYYEIIEQGLLHPIANVTLATPAPTGPASGEQPAPTAKQPTAEVTPLTDLAHTAQSSDELTIATSPHSDQNAADAAEYWTIL